MPFGQVPKGFLLCFPIDYVKRMREISLEKDSRAISAEKIESV